MQIITALTVVPVKEGPLENKTLNNPGLSECVHSRDECKLLSA